MASGTRSRLPRSSTFEWSSNRCDRARVPSQGLALSTKSPGVASILAVRIFIYIYMYKRCHRIYVAVRIFFLRSLFLALTHYWCCRCCLTPSRNFSEFRCVGHVLDGVCQCGETFCAMPHMCEMDEVSACRKASSSAIFHAHTCTYHEN